MLKSLTKIVTFTVLMAGATAAFAQEKVRLVHSTNSFAFVPFFTAVAMDHFAEVGLEAEVIRAGSGSKTVAAVVGGSADVGVGAASGVLFSRKEGIDMVMMSGLVTQYSSSIVFSKDWAAQQGLTAESPYEDMLKGMKGARIGTSGPGGGDHIVRYFAREAGLDPDRDLTIVYLGSDIAVFQAAMENDQIDGIAMSAPTPQIAIRDQGAIYAFDTGAGKVPALNGFLYIVTSARKDWIDANPETARKVDAAFQLALDTINDPARTDEARDRVHAMYYADTDKALFDQIWAEFAAGASKTTKITRDQIERVVEFTNAFETENPIDPATIDGSFVE